MDFVTVINGEIVDLMEVKTADSNISPAWKYYADKLKSKQAVQLVADLKRPFEEEGIKIIRPIDFFKLPPWLEIK